jgi:hypothetical protein
MFAVGLAALRYRVIPRWLGWLGIVFAVAGIPTGLGLLSFGLWPILVSVFILIRANTAPVGLRRIYEAVADAAASPGSSASITDPASF